MAQLNIYVPDHFITALKEKAKADDRSVSYIVAKAITAALGITEEPPMKEGKKKKKKNK